MLAHHHQVPVVDGYSSQHLTGRLNVAGRHITAYLADLLTRRGYSFNRCMWGWHAMQAWSRQAEQSHTLTCLFARADG